jgi:hypothetical protein
MWNSSYPFCVTFVAQWDNMFFIHTTFSGKKSTVVFNKRLTFSRILKNEHDSTKGTHNESGISAYKFLCLPQTHVHMF